MFMIDKNLSIFSECPTESTNMQVNDEEKLYELIQDVKVELEESQNQFVDDLKDEDYGKAYWFWQHSPRRTPPLIVVSPFHS